MTTQFKKSSVMFVFLSIGHFLDHLLMLIFATAAALRLATEWSMEYASLIPYATPGFIAFAVCAIPAGWIADKWSRNGMMVVFFIGLGASSIFTAMANSPFQIAVGLVFIGVFAAIYHPVGLAMVVQGRQKTGIPLAINGIFGNMGVASATILTGFLIDTSGWRNAFILPGISSILIGLLFLWFIRTQWPAKEDDYGTIPANKATESSNVTRTMLLRVFGVIFFTTAIGGIIFQSTTFALPKVFDERLTDLAGTATMIGWYAFLVFSVAAFGQLIVGYLVDNYSIRIVFAIVAILQAVFFFIMGELNGTAALVIAIAFMLVVFGQIPINDVLVGRMVHTEWRSRAYAIRYIVTFSVMALAVPLIAWIHGTWGFNILFELLSIAAFTIFVAVLMLPRSKKVLHQ
ncbi:MAG: MFS transporter [SAR324 cluster bacterium]|nr:MFS transporter [SAR324 cluster bacterium]